jgi:Dolichyl-phosphate-mannose-protein mannosyltransferase
VTISTRGDRLVPIALAAGSLLVNITIVAATGIKHGGDTVRYLSSAGAMLEGRAFRGPAGWLYTGYSGLIALSDALGAGDVGVIAVQVAAAALATLALYGLGRELHGIAAGVLAAGAFIIDVDIARWHAYLLTDSLYISLVLLTTFLAHRAVGRGPAAYGLASAVALFAALVRPNGWILIPIAVVYWIARTGIGRIQKVAAAACVLLLSGVAALSIAAVRTGAETWQAYGNTPPQARNPERLPFARELTADNHLAPVRVARRVGEELAHVRSTFSMRHNAAIVAVLAVTYPLAIVGFVRVRTHPAARLIAALIAAHMAVVALTFADRDGRYLLYVFPLIVTLAACGAVSIRRRRDFDLSFRDA